MIQSKQKPCKGRGTAKGEGCGKTGFYNSMNKGLCSGCWPKWLLNTDEGKEHLDRVQIKAKKSIEFARKKDKTKQRRALLSVDAYRSKVLQPVINEIVRLIDHEQPCIASGVTYGKFSGGHFTSVGANRLIALNVHNIHIQAYHSNGPQGGQPIEYLQGLRDIYSHDYAEFVMSLRGYKRQHKFRKFDFEEVYPIAVKIRNRLRRNKLRRSPEQRLKMRNIVNRMIGLYPNSSFGQKTILKTLQQQP